jgi:UDP-2,4-diacetamido-2,4,6-trideoxy-beta-L-altropyranose hydrolase
MNLLIRADASVAIGTGHVMRCLALAQAWQDAGGKATFAMAERTLAIEARLESESCEIVSMNSGCGSPEDAIEAAALARRRRAEWIVVDGYRFSADYQRALKHAGFKLLFIDDYVHAQRYCGDFVLNQNVHATEAMYSARAAYTRLLLGPRYCMLRREFAPWRGWKREIVRVGRKVLVTMGGSDSENLTCRMIDALAMVKSEGMEATVVVGGSNPHYAELKKAAVVSGKRIRVLKDVSNLPKLMSASDVAISAAGSTCWELCLLGVPSLLIDVAENQTGIAKELAKRGCAIHAGDGSVAAHKIARQLEDLLQSREQRQLLAERCRGLVDGRGAERVVAELTRG